MAAAAFLFAPAAALYPEVVKSDITASEWALGGAQIALLAAPGIGAVVGKALSPLAGAIAGKVVQATAGVVFAQHTIRNWNKMTPAEQAISAAMDIWIISSVFSGLRGFRASAAAKGWAAACSLWRHPVSSKSTARPASSPAVIQDRTSPGLYLNK